MTGDIPKTVERRVSSSSIRAMRVISAHHVKQMLINRSQLQPVMKPAAAGGNKIATCASIGRCQLVLRIYEERLTRMRTTSEALTMVSGVEEGAVWLMVGFYDS
jgi:hypothetical protein